MVMNKIVTINGQILHICMKCITSDALQTLTIAQGLTKKLT